MDTKPKEKIIGLLNQVLTAELTAINQYFLHAEMCRHWGYERLYGKIRKSAVEEMKHAEELIERVLFLEGVPNVQRLGKINIGETVSEQFKADYALELEAVQALNSGIAACREAGDNNTRVLLESILHSEEEHVDWLEAQTELIKQVGLQNYLASQIHNQE